MAEPTPPLSEEGLRRREQILARALAEAGRRRRRRAGGRVGIVCAVIGGLVTAILLIRAADEGKAPEVVKRVPPETSPPTAPAEPRVIFTRIQTDPGIVERLAIHVEPARPQRIRDDELLSELAAANQPAGLAYIDGKAVLLFR